MRQRFLFIAYLESKCRQCCTDSTLFTVVWVFYTNNEHVCVRSVVVTWRFILKFSSGFRRFEIMLKRSIMFNAINSYIMFLCNYRLHYHWKSCTSSSWVPRYSLLYKKHKPVLVGHLYVDSMYMTECLLIDFHWRGSTKKPLKKNLLIPFVLSFLENVFTPCSKKLWSFFSG